MSEKRTENSTKFKFGLNVQTAKYINSLHNKLEVREKSLIEAALIIGSVLFKVQEKCGYGDFLKWLSENVCFKQATAYRYITLFNNQDKISDAKNLMQAYKKVDTIMKQKKEKEKAAADKRVETYEETGKKPEGWRKNTDDKLAKKKQERKPDDNAEKKEAEKKQVNEKKEPEKQVPEKKEQKKTEQDDRQDSEFNDILMDYLNLFTNNSRKIIACNNIIKMCRKVKDDLQ
jgi:hypothetical protein